MTDTVIDIADPGDLILKLGQGNDVVRIKVNSHILRAASRPFKVMLGPQFAEGKGLSFEEPKEIPLTDDDPDAMQTICQILHLKNHAVTEHPTSHTILAIAQAVDKYLLHEALSFATAKWLVAENMKTVEDLKRLLAAAILLDHSRVVKRVTQVLVLDHTETQLVLTEGELSEKMVRIILALNQERTRLRLTFNQAVFDAIKIDDSNPQCNCILRNKQELSRIIVWKQLQPTDVAARPLNSCVTDLILCIPAWVESQGSRTCGYGDHHEVSRKTWKDLRLKLQTIATFPGVEIDSEGE